MRWETLHPDVLMFVGEDHESVATAFIDGDDALLIDSLGSLEDARELRRVLCGQLDKTVRMVAATHFMSDHTAGMSLFPEALTLAHRHYRHTFLSQNQPQAALYREPRAVFDGAMTLRWGRHQLRLEPNPGKTLDHLYVDVPSADLVCVGDNIVGRIVYLSKADPAMIRAAIQRVRGLGRGTVIGGHIGRFPAEALDHAIHYLDRLRETVIGLRADAIAVDERIAAIAIETCLAPGVEPVEFEREWHRRNLQVVIAQSVFALDAALSASEVGA